MAANEKVEEVTMMFRSRADKPAIYFNDGESQLAIEHDITRGKDYNPKLIKAIKAARDKFWEVYEKKDAGPSKPSDS